MGHLRLGRLPKRKNWQQVVSLIQGGAGVNDIAVATQKAADRNLLELGNNPSPGLVYAFWLLTQIPLAAKEDSLSKSLKKLDIQVSETPSLDEILSSVSESIDDYLFENGSRTDLDEISQLSLLSTLNDFGSDPNLSFLEITPEETKQRLGELATVKWFGAMARDFFAKFSYRFLTYFLSAELSNHVGGEKRFKNIKEHTEFLEALNTYCKESSKIVEQYSGQWFSKTNFYDEITPDNISRFLHVALRKMRSELKRGGSE